MGLTYTQYAAHRKERGLIGGTQPAVSGAVASGRIDRLPDGTIDPEVADRQWEERTRKMKQREPEPPPERRGPGRPRNIPDRVDAPDGQITLSEAERRKLAAEAQTKELELARKRGDTVFVEEAEGDIFAWTHAQRQLWEQMPALVYAQGAAELGVDPGKFRVWLDRTINRTLIVAGQIPFTLKRQECAA